MRQSTRAIVTFFFISLIIGYIGIFAWNHWYALPREEEIRAAIRSIPKAKDSQLVMADRFPYPMAIFYNSASEEHRQEFDRIQAALRGNELKVQIKISDEPTNQFKVIFQGDQIEGTHPRAFWIRYFQIRLRKEWDEAQ